MFSFYNQNIIKRINSQIALAEDKWDEEGRTSVPWLSDRKIDKMTPRTTTSGTRPTRTRRAAW